MKLELSVQRDRLWVIGTLLPGGWGGDGTLGGAPEGLHQG